MSNWNQVETQWHTMAAQVKAKWAKLTDDDIKLIAGKRDLLIGKLQERYSELRADTEKRVDAWVEKLNQKVSDVGAATHSADPAAKPVVGAAPPMPQATPPVAPRGTPAS